MTLKHVTAFALFFYLLHGSVAAQMLFTTRATEIVHILYAGVDSQDDAMRRVAIRGVCEQIVFELGPQWGNKKRAGLGDEFRSPDSIAHLNTDGTIDVWDVQASSGAILVFSGKPPDHPHLPSSEAAFMPCAPVNHLAIPNPGPILPNPGTPHLDLSRLETKLDVLTERLIAHETAEAAEREAQAQYREAVRTKWARFWKGTMKVGWKLAPVIGGLLAGVIGS